MTYYTNEMVVRKKIRNAKEGRSQYVREKVSYRDAPARIYSEEESLEISSSHNPPSFSHSLALSLPAFLIILCLYLYFYLSVH